MKKGIWSRLKASLIILMIMFIGFAPSVSILGFFSFTNRATVHAATTTTNPTSGSIGGGTWNVSSTGVLTVSNATLPANNSDSSTFWPWIQAGVNTTITSVVFNNVKPPSGSAPASVAYLFANLPNCTTINAAGFPWGGFYLGPNNEDQRKLFDGDYALTSGTVGSFYWNVDKTSCVLTLDQYQGSLAPLSNTDDDANFWPWLQVDPNNPDGATNKLIKTIKLNYPISASTDKQSDKESYAWLFGNLPNLTTFTPPSGQSPINNLTGVVDIAYLFGNDSSFAGPIDLSGVHGCTMLIQLLMPKEPFLAIQS